MLQSWGGQGTAILPVIWEIILRDLPELEHFGGRLPIIIFTSSSGI